MSSLFSLSKAAQDASYAIVEFVNLVGSDKIEAAGLNDSLAAPINAAAAALADAQAVKAAADSPTAVDAAAEPKKRKRVTKVKDPNAPKRPLPAYLVFGNEVKREIRRTREANKEDPLTMSELNEMVHEKWTQLDPKHKKTLEDDHAKAVSKYNKLREAYEGKQASQEDGPSADTPTDAPAAAAAASDAEEEPPASPEKKLKAEASEKKRKGEGEKKRKKKKDKDAPSSP